MDRIATAEIAAQHYIRDWPKGCQLSHCPFLSRPEQEVFSVAAVGGLPCGSVTVHFEGDRIMLVKAHLMGEPQP